VAQVKKAKLLTKPGYNGVPLDSGPLSVLRDGGRTGIVFPYTPTINVNGSANYNALQPPHTNYPANVFENSVPPQFNIAWQFTAQTTEEADYMLGAIHFMRTMSKAHFGKSDQFAGTPPPVLEFSAYGEFMFSAVPVLIRSYTYDMNTETDYVDTSFGTQVPTFMQGFLDVTVQVNPDRTRNEFSLKGIADGSLIRKGYI